MANTFLTPQVLVRDGAWLLQNNSVMPNLANRNYEDQFVSGIGDTVEITVPDRGSVSEFSGTTTAEDVVETKVDLTMEKHFYRRIDLTAKQKSMDLDSFTDQILRPAAEDISTKVDEYVLKTAVAGYARYFANAEGSDPSTVAHLVAGRKLLQDNKVPMSGRVGILSTTAEASMLSLDQFTSTNYQPDAQALIEANLGRLYGVNWFVDQNCATLSRGDVDQVTNMAATEAVGTSTITVDDGAGTSAGTVKKGARFTIAGDTQVYTVTADATASGGAIELPITPALLIEADNNDAITWKSALKENLVYHPQSLAVAVMAPAPLSGVNSASYSHNGIGMRISMDGSLSTLADSIVIDVYAGAVVIDPKGGAVIGGA